MTEIRIDRRYCGPAQSANGGFACGVIASALPGAVRVRLMAPPPLDTPLVLERIDDATAVLRHGETIVGRGECSDTAPTAPSAPSPADAARATLRYTGHQSHALPECFVCGPSRDAPDGLRIFAGKLDPGGPALAPWRPDASVCDDGRARLEVVWAVLDCPGYFGVANPGEAALLGQMTGAVMHRPKEGEACIAMGWAVERAGRKLHAGSALFDEGGRCCGVSEQVWIKPKA
ncbi:MAG: hypothetical protein AAF721_24290 [Myxococcota bacterium]